MKKIQKKILAVILSAIVAFSMPTALAVDAYYNLPLDVGNHHRYSGGSRSRSRSRSNSRSRSRSYSSSGRSSSSGSSEIDQKTAIILVIAFLVIFVSVFGLIIWCVKQPDKKSKKYKNIPPMFPYNATEQITEFIKQNDENFNLEKFLNWVKNIFLTLENAFSQRDWQKIFTFESKELFEEHNAQIQELISLGRVNIKDNINIIDAYLHKLVIDENSENLTVSIRATMNNYIVDEASGSIITGKKEEVFDTIYQMTFVRTNGIKTTIINGESITKIEKSDWTLTKFEPVDNNFVDDISGIVFNNNNKF